MVPTYLLGLDLGQRRDYTALAVLAQTPGPSEPTYQLIHLDRWRGRSYREVVPAVRHVERQLHQAGADAYLARHGSLPGSWDGPASALLVDQTGVGIAVVDDLRAHGLDCIGVTIHGGDAVSRSGRDYRVPKRELVGTVDVLLQARRLALPDADTLPLAGVLIEELENFRAKISLGGHDTYGAGEDWRDRAHDDLVLALGMAAWYGELHAGTAESQAVLDDYLAAQFSGRR